MLRLDTVLNRKIPGPCVLHYFLVVPLNHCWVASFNHAKDEVYIWTMAD